MALGDVQRSSQELHLLLIYILRPVKKKRKANIVKKKKRKKLPPNVKMSIYIYMYV